MIAIVTDSSVGYSTAEIADRGIVSVVPLNYNVGGKNFEEKAVPKLWNSLFLEPFLNIFLKNGMENSGKWVK